MSQSHTLFEKSERLTLSNGARRRVLVTGAAGRIGSYFAEHASDRYDLRLMVRESDENVDWLRKFGEVVTCDLGDLDGLKKVCDDIDTVVHLAGNPEPEATWDELLPANITGVYNMFVAAKAAKCRRVIFASSVHAVTGYPYDTQIKTDDPVNPGTLYGVTKCFGEAMARYMAEQEGVSAIAIRIGGYQPMEWARNEKSVGWMPIYLSPNDMNQMLNLCIDDTTLIAIVHALSDNRFKLMDITDTRELLGYDPQDDMAKENPLLKHLAIHKSPGSREMPRERSGIRNDL